MNDQTPIDDGGTAFPGFAYIAGHGPSRPVQGPTGEVLWETHEAGMTLRAYYAGEAMKGLLSNPAITCPSASDPKEIARFAEDCAALSLTLAAALLAELRREKEESA